MWDEDEKPEKKESFNAEDLKNDLDRINKIALSWRFKMEFLPADREFATFRRAVTHLEKSMKLVYSVLIRYYGVSEEELKGSDGETSD